MIHRGALTALAAILALFVATAAAAAASKQFHGKFAGQPNSSIGMSVSYKANGDPKRMLISYSGAEGTCDFQPGAFPLSGVFQSVPVREKNDKFSFKATVDEPGTDAHIVGAFSPNGRKITGDLDHTRHLEPGDCSLKNLPYTAKRE